MDNLADQGIRGGTSILNLIDKLIKEEEENEEDKKQDFEAYAVGPLYTPIILKSSTISQDYNELYEDSKKQSE